MSDSTEWTFGAGSFIKIYGDRLAESSLLDCAVATRWLFLFMGARADREGRFRCATVAGLARAAAVSVAEAEAAIAELEAPDPASTSPEHEGRRILRIPGGWQIVTYRRYRDFRTPAQARAAERQRRHRDRGARDITVTSQPVTVTARDVTARHPQMSDVRCQSTDTDNGMSASADPAPAAAARPPSRSRTTSTADHPEASRFVTVFNAVFGRRVTCTPGLASDFTARAGRYPAATLCALPVLVAAQGIPADLRKGLQAGWLLRDGSRGYTRQGERHPGMDWIERALQRADRTTLFPAHAEIARTHGVLDTLLSLGVRVADDASEAIA